MSKTTETKETTKTQAPLSPIAEQVLVIMLPMEAPITLAKIHSLGFTEVNSSHLKALENRGLITAEKQDIQMQVIQKRKVNSYTWKKMVEDFSEYKLSERAIEAYKLLLEQNEPMILAEMKLINENLNSAHLTSLVRADLVEAYKVEREIETIATRKVNVYKLV